MALKDPQPLKNAPEISVHSATGYDKCPIGLKCNGIIIDNLQFRHIFTECKNLQMMLIIGLHMQ